MKKFAVLLLITLTASPAWCLIFPNAIVPDFDPNGIQSSQSYSGFGAPLTDVNLTLNISGGFNGDFYGYLSHNGIRAVFLNRVGVGSSSAVGYPDRGFGAYTAGLAFTFDDQAAADIHWYRSGSFSLNGDGQLTGAWQPDGRDINPQSAPGAFDLAARSKMLSAFNGTDPNGEWLLFISDLSQGGEGRLVSWSLEIVPEPATGSLLLLAAMVAFLRSRRLPKIK